MICALGGRDGVPEKAGAAVVYLGTDRRTRCAVMQYVAQVIVAFVVPENLFTVPESLGSASQHRLLTRAAERDGAPGIAPKKLPYMFDCFFGGARPLTESQRERMLGDYVHARAFSASNHCGGRRSGMPRRADCAIAARRAGPARPPLWHRPASGRAKPSS